MSEASRSFWNMRPATIIIFGIIAMAIGISLAKFALSEVEPPDNCDLVKTGAAWMDKDVVTREDLRAEIDALVIDNRCDGITPAKLHKVLRDLERIVDR